MSKKPSRCRLLIDSPKALIFCVSRHDRVYLTSNRLDPRSNTSYSVFVLFDLALESLERSLPVLAFDFPSELLLPAVINAGRLHVPYSPVIPAMDDCRTR